MIRKPNIKFNWKYALGELFLIFLGISLAITFQNWNQERLQRIESSEAQQVIKSDLETVIAEMKSMVQLENEHNKILFRFGSQSGLDSMSRLNHFDSLTFDALWSYGNINPSFPAYEALLASGKIEIIKNKQFRLLLSEMDAKFKGMVNAVNERQTAQLMHIDPVLINLFDVPRLRNAYVVEGQPITDIITQNVNHKSMLKSAAVQNAMAYKLSLGLGVKSEIEDFINACTQIQNIAQ